MVRKEIKVRAVISCAIMFIAIILGYLVVNLNSNRTVAAYTNTNLIRFHVLANSNEPADQDLKLKVRDAILQATQELFPAVAYKEQARAIIVNNWDYIQAVATNTVKSNGYDYGVTMQLGEFTFPDRTYGTLNCPSGEYEALRIVIGSGKGDNWWCVLFPPLCFVDLEQDLVNEDIIAFAPHLPQGNVEFRWKFWDKLKDTEYGQRIEDFWLASVDYANSWSLPLLKTK